MPRAVWEILLFMMHCYEIFGIYSRQLTKLICFIWKMCVMKICTLTFFHSNKSISSNPHTTPLSPPPTTINQSIIHYESIILYYNRNTRFLKPTQYKNCKRFFFLSYLVNNFSFIKKKQLQNSFVSLILSWHPHKVSWFYWKKNEFYLFFCYKLGPIYS